MSVSEITFISRPILSGLCRLGSYPVCLLNLAHQVMQRLELSVRHRGVFVFHVVVFLVVFSCGGDTSVTRNFAILCYSIPDAHDGCNPFVGKFTALLLTTFAGPLAVRLLSMRHYSRASSERLCVRFWCSLGCEIVRNSAKFERCWRGRN